jgi:glutathione S-transferase
VVAWLPIVANEVALEPNRLRLHYKFGRVINYEESRQVSIKLLDIMQGRLESHPYLATDQITIADIAVHPYIALAPEGKIDLSLYAIESTTCRST